MGDSWAKQAANRRDFRATKAPADSWPKKPGKKDKRRHCGGKPGRQHVLGSRERRYHSLGSIEVCCTVCGKSFDMVPRIRLGSGLKWLFRSQPPTQEDIDREIEATWKRLYGDKTPLLSIK